MRIICSVLLLCSMLLAAMLWSQNIGLAPTQLSNPSGGGVTGSGTVNNLVRWTSSTALGDAGVTDNGTTLAVTRTGFAVPIAAGAAPTADGDLRYDSTQDKWVGGGGTGAETGSFPRLLAATCRGTGSCAAADTRTADSAEAQFATEFVAKANYFITNKGMIVGWSLKCSSSASSVPTSTYRIRLDSATGTVLYQSVGTAGQASLSNRTQTWSFIIMGTASAGAAVGLYTAPYSITGQDLSDWRVANQIDQPVTGIDTTVAHDVVFTLQYSNSTAGNSCTVLMAWQEEIN